MNDWIHIIYNVKWWKIKIIVIEPFSQPLQYGFNFWRLWELIGHFSLLFVFPIRFCEVFIRAVISQLIAHWFLAANFLYSHQQFSISNSFLIFLYRHCCFSVELDCLWYWLLFAYFVQVAELASISLTLEMLLWIRTYSLFSPKLLSEISHWWAKFYNYLFHYNVLSTFLSAFASALPTDFCSEWFIDDQQKVKFSSLKHFG